MTFPLDDLSPAALETIADLIEERLDAPASLVPVTWGRFLIQGSLPLFLLLALALRDVLHRSPLGARLARETRP